MTKESYIVILMILVIFLAVFGCAQFDSNYHPNDSISLILIEEGMNKN